ncbi:MAG: Ig-like domain-containing protein [Spirochaetes bacterium]|nr:Ig-like domain-containing protein [Spirochaetota bacterium]
MKKINTTNSVILAIVIFTAGILFAIGCNNNVNFKDNVTETTTANVQKLGSLSLNINDSKYRTIMPTFSINHFDLSADGPNGAGFQILDLTADTAFKSDMAVGAWTITVFGKDLSENAVAKGIATVNIVEGTNDATIDVNYVQDTSGSVNITIDWTSSDVSIDSVILQINSEASSDIYSSGTSVNYTNVNMPSGFYIFKFQLFYQGVLRAGSAHSVHIYDYLSSAATISLTSNDFSKPPAAPTSLNVVKGLNKLVVSWPDSSNVEEGYTLERSVNDALNFIVIGADLPPNATFFEDVSVDPDVNYYYRVKAFNSFGESQYNPVTMGTFVLPNVSNITPALYSTGIPANTDIIINFNGEMNLSIFGTVTLSGYVFQNNVNCSMTISGNVLTINPNTDFPGGVYSGIAVSGFQDISGNLMISYNNPDYNFSVNGMIAYYPFDATLDDMSGNGYNMTFTTSYTGSSIPMLIIDRYGLPDAAYRIYESDCYMDTTITTIPSSFTISAWVYNEGTSMDQIVFSKYNDLSSDDKHAEMCLKKDTMGNLKFFMGNGINLGLDINGNNNSMNEDMSNDKWHNVVITFDGMNGNMYIDGALSGSGTFSGTRQNTTTPLYFGYYYSTQTSYYWSGKLDDIRIYNYAQNGTEILDIYNSEKPLPFGVLEINYPATGQIVEPTTDIRIVFDSTMDPNPYGEYTIAFVNPPINLSNSYGVFSFSTTNKEYDTVTFNSSYNLPADTYSGITITGFKNAGGSLMTEYADATYDFKVRGEVALFLFNGNVNSYINSTLHDYSCLYNIFPTFVNDRNNESGKAISFNVVDNYLDTQISKLDGDFTLSAWVSYTDTTVPRPIISKYNTSDANSQFNLQIDTNGNLNFFMGDGSGKGIILDGNNDTASDLIANNWYHVAVSMNGTTGRLFINGIETDSGTFAGTRQTETNGINLGRYFNGAFQYFNGKIDDVHVYNYALTTAEIGGIYSAEKPKVYVMNILSPADGALDVSPDANIVIQFSGSLDGTTFGTMTFNQPDFTYTNAVNCAMSFTTTNVTNDTVIIDPMTNFVGMQYMTITSITGFKDVGGVAMMSYSNPSYDFTAKSISLYYKFDGDLSDDSGYPGSIKLDGIPAYFTLPDLTTDRHGTINAAYLFSPVEENGIKSAGWVDISGSDPITMSLWVKAASTDYASDQVISVLGTSDVDATRFGLYINGTTTDRVGFYGYGTANFVSDATLDTEWTHWSATYDGTTVKLYRNGVFNTSQSIALDIGYGSNGSPYVGAWTQSSYTSFFDGCIDEVRIYNYALTESEILAIYNEEKPIQ